MRLSVLLALLVLAGPAFAAITSNAQRPVPPETVEQVDLKRYIGRWYEIARIPNSFQEQCAWGVSAQYTLRDDGRIDVINSCYKADGKLDTANGLARIEDSISNARLKVSFFSILGWRPIWGDYWIIGLADDYEYAVVGSPDRRYGWILAREKRLEESKLEQIFTLLREQGYDPGDFQMTQQESNVSGSPRALY